jgi:hypothetical protein
MWEKHMRKQIGFAIASFVAVTSVSARAAERPPVLAKTPASIPYSASIPYFAEIASIDEGSAAMLAQPYRMSTVYDSPAAALAADFGGPIMLPDLAVNAGQDEELVATSTDGANDLIALDNLLFLDIPEPSTWAMLVAGLGLMGVGLRRSRRTSIQFS